MGAITVLAIVLCLWSGFRSLENGEHGWATLAFIFAFLNMMFL